MQHIIRRVLASCLLVANIVAHNYVIIGAPFFIEEPSASYSYINRPDGHFITLPCHAGGTPSPEIKWFRSGVEQINLDSSNSSFVISGGALLIPIGKEPLAEVVTYHCTATNTLGTIRSSATVIRPAFIEPFRPTRLDAYPLTARGGGARLDCQAPPHYPKSHSYSWMRGGITDRFVEVDQRVFVSMDGTLYFSHNLKDDANSYACTLALNSPRTGQYGPFFNLVLPQNGELGPFAPRIDEYQPQVFPEIPKRGQTIHIECVAYGFPTPVYNWTRVDGRPLSPRHEIVNFGRVLRIVSVQPEDAVRYKCIASNNLGVASAELHLVIQSPPSLVRPLVDQLVAIGETVRFPCPAAEPTPGYSTHVEWFRNAQPLVPLLMATEDRKRFRLKNHELQIRDVRPTDAGMYQCRLSNEVGSTGSAAHLSVQNVAPKFHPNVFPQRVFVVEGTRLILPCLYHAVPRGKAMWLKHGPSGSSKFEEVVENNVSILLIENFTKEHAGRYECRTLNSVGAASAFVNISLMARPKVSISQSVRPDADGFGIRLTCEAELECTEADVCPEAHFDWQFNDQSTRGLSSRGRLKMRQFVRSVGDDAKLHQRAELDASSSFVNHNVGRFACSSVFGGASAELEPFNGASLAAALTPTQLKVLDVQATSVKLAWRLAPLLKYNENAINFKLEGYVIEYRQSEDRLWRQHDTIYKTNDRIIGSFAVRNLHSNTRYQFRVRARTLDGTLSLASTATDWLHTPASAPDDVVRNLRWRLLDMAHLLLEWDPVEVGHSTGPNLRYNVTWADSTGNVEHHFEIVNQASHVIALKPQHLKENRSAKRKDESDDCQVIAVGVQPLNDLGTGPAATDTVVYVTNNGPKRRAVDVTLETYNATHLNLSWSWAHAGECENVQGVQISCAEDAALPVDAAVTASNAIINVSISHQYTQWMVGGLSPWTNYRCSLAAFDQYGRRGQQSRTSKSARTAEPAPTQVPEITKVKLSETLTGYTTLLDWSPVRLNMATNSTANDRGYKVFVYISETAEKPVVLDLLESQLQDSNRPSARIDGLKLMFYYKIQVAGFNRGGVGPRSTPTTIRIGAPDSPSAAISRIPSSPSLCFTLLFLLWRLLPDIAK